MKQTELKLIQGGVQDSDAATPQLPKKGTRWWEYVWMFAVSGVVWIVLGIWGWRYLFR